MDSTASRPRPAARRTLLLSVWGLLLLGVLAAGALRSAAEENTGLGIWTEEMFVEALRTGRHMGQSRPILPPMPWQAFGQMTDHDLAAVYAYLRSIPPIKNRVPEAVIAEPPAAAPAH